MNDFTPLPAAMGGILVGLSATLFLFTHGRVAGISGHFGALVRGSAEVRADRIAFVLGLVAVGLVTRLVRPEALDGAGLPSWPLVLAAGVVVGVGTQVGNGCTSGHGVCGVSRFSPRSIVATVTFMATGIVTLFVVRHLLGGTP
ncbi:MAG: YeeE/YedE family protein [Polyangiaceae bacterium]